MAVPGAGRRRLAQAGREKEIGQYVEGCLGEDLEAGMKGDGATDFRSAKL